MVSKETYKQVWASMDACNSSGVIHSLDKWVDAIWLEARELGKGTAYVNSHPILVIVADKLLQLARVVTPDDAPSLVISKAYAFVCNEAIEL